MLNKLCNYWRNGNYKPMPWTVMPFLNQQTIHNASYPERPNIIAAAIFFSLGTTFIALIVWVIKDSIKSNDQLKIFPIALVIFCIFMIFVSWSLAVRYFCTGGLS